MVSGTCLCPTTEIISSSESVIFMSCDLSCVTIRAIATLELGIKLQVMQEAFVAAIREKEVPMCCYHADQSHAVVRPNEVLNGKAF